MGRSTSTSVKVHGGEIESLTQATSAGIGVRVIEDRRQGFAWAGSLDDDVIAEVLAEARDNVAYAQPEIWVGLAEPDGVEPPPIDLWRDGHGGAADRAQGRPGAGTRAGGPGPRPPHQRRAHRSVGRRGRRGGGGDVDGHRRGGALHVLPPVGAGAGDRRRRDQDRLRRVGRPRAGRRRSRRGCGRRGRPRHSAAGRRSAGERQRLARARTPHGGDAARRRGGHPQRGVGAQGPLALRRPDRRADRVAAGDAGRRSDRPDVARGRHPRRRGAGDAAQCR